MGFATGNHDGVAGIWPSCRFLQVLGQAARIAPLLRFGRWAQPFAQAFFHRAEMHLAQCLATQSADVGHVLTQFGRVLLGAPHRHVHQTRDMAQAHGIGDDGRVLKNGGHQAGLVIDQDELGFKGV